MKQVASILNSLLKSLGIEDRVKLGFLQQKWRSIFNEPLSLHTYPADLKDGELLINVDSPAWLGQLKFFRTDMIRNLHDHNIKDIRFRLGRVFHAKDHKARGMTVPNRKYIDLTASDIEWIEQTVSSISDAELKENIKKTIEKALKRRC